MIKKILVKLRTFKRKITNVDIQHENKFLRLWQKQLSNEDNFIYNMMDSNYVHTNFEIHNKKDNIFIKLMRFEGNYKMIIFNLNNNDNKFFEKEFIISKESGDKMTKSFSEELIKRSKSIEDIVLNTIMDEINQYSEK